MKNGVLIPAVIVALLVGAGGGFVTGMAAKSKELQTAAFEAGKKEAMNQINEKFVAQGMSAPLSEPVMQVYGHVKQVDSTGLVLEYDTAQFSIAETGVVTKRVSVSGAKIEKMASQLSGETLQPPVDGGVPSGGPGSEPGGGGYTGVAGEPGGSGTAPVTVPGSDMPAPSQVFYGTPTGTPATLADIKVGDYVQVTVASDIRTATELTAETVTIFDMKNLTGDAVDPSRLPFSRGGATRATELPYVPTK